jgi:hypothetical protein
MVGKMAAVKSRRSRIVTSMIGKIRANADAEAKPMSTDRRLIPFWASHHCPTGVTLTSVPRALVATRRTRSTNGSVWAVPTSRMRTTTVASCPLEEPSRLCAKGRRLAGAVVASERNATRFAVVRRQGGSAALSVNGRCGIRSSGEATNRTSGSAQMPLTSRAMWSGFCNTSPPPAGCNQSSGPRKPRTGSRTAAGP